ncbi:zinc transporter 5 [Cinnamomum micranthum f. kanehirae]|uniref:Zinc transporter 5 n=1 Tax=Cinnamomum micranthum f. kanehirae TaxID=337451 RepID=A0A443PSW4_9MAGN|nr:zinc transporter 5 [Cinnamomum micranthum f. kanehirae]
MMSPKPDSDDRISRSIPTRHTPLQIIHVIGNFMRVWSIYSMYQYLSQQGASVALFIFACLVPSSIIFLALQKPWKGRALSNSQVIPSIINGGITALYFILWGKGVKSCGPLRAILAEYSGAVLGVLSALLYGRRGRIWKKVGGLIAMVAALFFLSQGWAMTTYSPLDILSTVGKSVQEEGALGIKDMVVPISAGILSALRRVIARRVSLKNQLKRRLHAITITSATCFLFPLAMWDVILGTTDNSIMSPFPTWAFLSTILFGVILIFYVDNIAEERLHLVFSSPRHLMVAGGCIIVMEIAYKMDFSLVGFLFCSSLLGLGIYHATSLDRTKKSYQPLDLSSDGTFESHMQTSPLPT